MMLIDVGGISIELIRKPVKNVHIRVHPPYGKVSVSVPLHLSQRQIHTLLVTKTKWIREQQEKIQSQPLSRQRLLQTGEQHYFLGYPYSLLVDENATINKITLDNDGIRMQFKPGATLLEKNNCLQQWYKQQLAAMVPALISKWEPILGVSVFTWHSRYMKTRWGSCNIRTRRICLNLTLIQKPMACIEYVVVHEMVHLLEPSHNQRFHQLMDKFLPNWREQKRQLRTIEE